LLLIGLLLLAGGLIFFFVPGGAGLTEWLMRLWPVFLVCAGVVRVMGYAVERKPRSPLGGMLLMVVGVLFLAARFHSDLNVLQIYGRYWLLLLAVFAAVELVRYYSHRHTEGPPPRLFTPWRLIVILIIVTSGVLASRVASNTSLLSALRLPGFLSGLRDSVVGETYAFTDPAVVVSAIRPGVKITINNSYGGVTVTGSATNLRATLTKGVRAWNEADARKVAERIRLTVSQNSDGFIITTNRDQVNQQFTTDIQVEVPAGVALSITDSYGPVVANNIQADVAVKASYGRAELNSIAGDVSLALIYSDVDASNIRGDVSINGAKRARLSNVTGAVELAASNSTVELRDISGPARVDAPFCRISAQGLGSDAEFRTEHGSVRIARAAGVSIIAPNSDVRAENINGDLHITASHQGMVLRSIAGELVVRGEQASVSADEVRGAIDVETSHGEVSLKNFYESVRVETSFRDVTIVAAGQPAGDIEVENNHGEIKLVLPQSSQFQLDAASASGQIKPIGFSEIPPRPRESLVAALGSDGPTIKLRTSYKNITIQASTARQTQATGLVNQ